ncbi:MAG: hypothetical protein V1644_01360 [Candidatus Micrarchaeota archaeon]
MVDKLLVGVAIVVVIAAAAVFFNWPTLRPALPEIENTGDASCTLQASSCNGDVLTFYRCSNGSSIKNEYDCTKLADGVHNWTCNPSQVIVKNGVSTTRANCDYASVVQQSEGASDANSVAASSSATGSPNATASQSAGVQRAPPLAYCGNGVIDADETCMSCAEDYACTVTEFCEEQSGLCTKINAFGDDRCTQEENSTGTDCYNCGCAENQICNEFSKRCQASVTVNAAFEAKVDSIVNLTLYNDSNSAYLGLVDTIYESKSAKMAVFDCDTSNTFFCRTFVIVDKNGNVLETVHSS